MVECHLCSVLVDTGEMTVNKAMTLFSSGKIRTQQSSGTNWECKNRPDLDFLGLPASVATPSRVCERASVAGGACSILFGRPSLPFLSLSSPDLLNRLYVRWGECEL